MRHFLQIFAADLRLYGDHPAADLRLYGDHPAADLRLYGDHPAAAVIAESTAMVGFQCAHLMSYFQELNSVAHSSTHAVTLLRSHIAGVNAEN